jgi:hypothetical protein
MAALRGFATVRHQRPFDDRDALGAAVRGWLLDLSIRRDFASKGDSQMPLAPGPMVRRVPGLRLPTVRRTGVDIQR